VFTTHTETYTYTDTHTHRHRQSTQLLYVTDGEERKHTHTLTDIISSIQSRKLKVELHESRNHDDTPIITNLSSIS